LPSITHSLLGVRTLTVMIEIGINQIYLIGGDGTHRAADMIYKHARDRGLKLTVVGIPKTIDNDIGTIDK
jgi:6-phosphofructokinase 1